MIKNNLTEQEINETIARLEFEEDTRICEWCHITIRGYTTSDECYTDCNMRVFCSDDCYYDSKDRG